jgi:hypothetical protein
MISNARSTGCPNHLQTVIRPTISSAWARTTFVFHQLSVSIEDTQLVIRGRQIDDPEREFLHRGIAARQFQQSFVLAEGIEIVGAELDNGLLHVNIKRPIVETQTRTIEIKTTPAQQRPDLRAIDIEPEEKVS